MHQFEAYCPFYHKLPKHKNLYFDPICWFCHALAHIVSTKIYDKRDDFDFDIVNFPYLDGDVPRRNSYGVYLSQLTRFVRASSHVNDFNNRNKFLTARLSVS